LYSFTNPTLVLRSRIFFRAKKESDPKGIKMSQEKKEVAPLDLLEKSKERHLLSYKRRQEDLEQMLQKHGVRKIEIESKARKLEDAWTSLGKVYDEMFYLLDRVPDDKNVEAFTVTLWDEKVQEENRYFYLITIAKDTIEPNSWKPRTRWWSSPKTPSIWNPPTRSWTKPRTPPNTPTKSPTRRSQENSPANPKATEPVTRQLELPKLVPQQFNCDISKRTSFWETTRTPQVNLPTGSPSTSPQGAETASKLTVTGLVARHKELPKQILQPFDGSIPKSMSFQESLKCAVYNQNKPEKKSVDAFATKRDEKSQTEDTDLRPISTHETESNGTPIRSKPVLKNATQAIDE
jgi:hypothetical protein